MARRASMSETACGSESGVRRPNVLSVWSLNFWMSLACEPTSMRATICLPKRPLTRATPERTTRTTSRSFALGGAWLSAVAADLDCIAPVETEPACPALGLLDLLARQLSQVPHWWALG